MARRPIPDDLAEPFHGGHERWNLFRAESGHADLDLSGCNLSAMNLRSYDFSNCNLADATFQKSQLAGATFSPATATGASFRRANLNGTTFRGAALRGADFKASIIKGADFDDCALNDADFSGSRISASRFHKSSLRNCRFHSAKLDQVTLSRCPMSGSIFRDARIARSDLRYVKLSAAALLNCEIPDCTFADSMFYHATFDACTITRSNFDRATFSDGKIRNCTIVQSQFREADFSNAQLSSNTFDRTDLSRSKIFGVSAWALTLTETVQENLVISDAGEAAITIDNIEIAQFIHLLIKNEKLRSVIDTITSKVVLILGRFSTEQMMVLNLLRDELRKRDYLPILFDFENSPNRDLTETVATLASLSKFVIADITDPKSIPQELSHIIPMMTSLPIQPIILKGHSEYGMFEHFRRYPWVLDIIEYESSSHIKTTVLDEIIRSCEGKLLVLRTK